MKLLFAVAVVFLSACTIRSPQQRAAERVLALERDDGSFQDLVRGGGELLDVLKAFQPLAPARGYPVVAILYAQGEGDAVPLDLKAAHYAAFRWPAADADENALVEPWVWDELEHDLLRAGRQALPFLARGLAQGAPDERSALRAARVMMRIGGRAAMEALAGLLEAGRELGGVRVKDVAAAALLVLGYQDLPLRQADPDAVVQSARDWWAAAKDQSAEEWIRSSREALAARRKEGDAEGVEPVLELLEAGGDAPLPTLQARLREGRGPAFDADRRLEQATSFSAWRPVWERLGELRASLRLWRPPEDLELRWRRLLGGKLLRFTVAAVGYRPREDRGGLLWAKETVLHPTESDLIELQIGEGAYIFHARLRDLGTRVALGEFAASGARVYEGSARSPLLHFSSDLRAAFLVTVEDVDARPAPRPPEAMKRDLRRTLRGLASEDGSRALAYLRDKDDLPLFLERKAGAALLLLGHPSALEYRPSLDSWEIDAALRVATDAKVREYLEGLRSAAPR